MAPSFLRKHSAKVAPAAVSLADAKLPYWLSHKKAEDIVTQCQHLDVEGGLLGSQTNEYNRMRVLRAHNQKLQLHSPSWTLMKSVEKAATSGKKVAIQNIMDVLSAKTSKSGADHTPDDILYKPGPVGDLPLHQAFLLGETELGIKLVEKFYCRPNEDGTWENKDGTWKFWPHPDKGINTPYMSDLVAWVPLVRSLPYLNDNGIYTGETVLHIAIVNSDTDLVAWMLKQGVCITARACGAFFKPKDSVCEDSVQDINMAAYGTGSGVQKFKNEDSVCDYGEFPFSFAASVGNTKILEMLARHAESGGIKKQELIEVLKTQRKIRALLGIQDEIVVAEKKGGFMGLLVGLQDSRGNTALHMAVQYNQKESVDWIMSHNGEESLHMLNVDGMTPFTLAAHMGNVSMLHHILDKHMKTTVWKFGSMSLSKLSLSQMDSYRTSSPLHQHPKWKSAIEIIVTQEISAFAQDEIMEELLLEKWNKFARRHYRKFYLVPYLLFLMTYFSTMALRMEEMDDTWRPSFVDGLLSSVSVPSNSGGGMTNIKVQWRELSSLVLHGFLIVFWLPWLVWTGYRSRHKKHDKEPVKLWIFKNLTVILGCLTCLGIVISSLARCTGVEWLERNLWSLGSIVCALQMLVFIIPFKFFGFIVISIYNMMVGDVTIFVLIYFLINLAFSLAIELSFVKCPSGIVPMPMEYATRLPGTLLYEYWTGLDNLSMDEQLLTYSRNSVATKVLHVTFIVLFNVLGLNLIIAMMGKTFAMDSEDVHTIWIFPFAVLVLRLEKNLSETQKRDCAHYRCGTSGMGATAELLSPTAKNEEADEVNEELNSSQQPWSWCSGSKKSTDKHNNSDNANAWETEFFIIRNFTDNGGYELPEVLPVSEVEIIKKKCRENKIDPVLITSMIIDAVKRTESRKEKLSVSVGGGGGGGCDAVAVKERAKTLETLWDWCSSEMMESLTRTQEECSSKILSKMKELLTQERMQRKKESELHAVTVRTAASEQNPQSVSGSGSGGSGGHGGGGDGGEAERATAGGGQSVHSTANTPMTHAHVLPSNVPARSGKSSSQVLYHVSGGGGGGGQQNDGGWKDSRLPSNTTAPSQSNSQQLDMQQQNGAFTNQRMQLLNVPQQQRVQLPRHRARVATSQLKDEQFEKDIQLLAQFDLELADADEHRQQYQQQQYQQQQYQQQQQQALPPSAYQAYPHPSQQQLHQYGGSQPSSAAASPGHVGIAWPQPSVQAQVHLHMNDRPAVVRPLDLTRSDPETARSTITSNLTAQQTSTPQRTPQRASSQVNSDTTRSSPRRRILDNKSLVDVPAGAPPSAGGGVVATARTSQFDHAPPQRDRAPSAAEQRANAAESKVAQLEKELVESKLAQLQKELEAERQKSKAAEEERLAEKAAAQEQVAAAQLAAAQVAAGAAPQTAVQHSAAAVKVEEEVPAVVAVSTSQQQVSAASQIQPTASNVTSTAVSLGGAGVGAQGGSSATGAGSGVTGAGSRLSQDSHSKKAEKKIMHGDPSIPPENRDTEDVRMSTQPTALPSAAAARSQSPRKKAVWGDPSIPPEFRGMEDIAGSAAQEKDTRAQKGHRPKLRPLNQPKPAAAADAPVPPVPTAAPSPAPRNAGAGMKKIWVQEVSEDGDGVIPDTDPMAAHARQLSERAAHTPAIAHTPAVPPTVEAIASSQQLAEAGKGDEEGAAGRNVKRTKLKGLPRLNQPNP